MPKLEIKAGVVKDRTPLQVGLGWSDTNLMRFHTGNIEPINGWTSLTSSTLTGACRAIKEWSTLSGTDLIAFGTNTHVYIYSSGVLYDITPADFLASGGGLVDATVATGYGIGGYGISPYGGTGTPATNPFDQIILEPTIWSLDNFGEILILNPHADIFDPGHIYVWDPSGGFSQRATLLSANPNATDVPEWAGGLFVSTQSQQVIAYGTPPFRSRQPDPMQIRWSDIADYTDWTPTAANSAGDYRLPSGSLIIGHLQTYFETLFFTDTTIYTMGFNGTNSVFTFNPIAQGISMIAPKAAVTNGSVVFWMDQGSFWQYNGSVTELDCPLKEFVFQGGYNTLQRFKIHAALNHEFSEVWWFYPSITSTEIDSYVVFNYRDNVWSNGLLSRLAWSDSGRNQNPIAVDQNGSIWLQEYGDDANGQPLPWSCTTGDIDTNGGETYTTLWRVIADLIWNGSAGQYQYINMDVRTKRTSEDPYLVARTVEINPTDSNNGYTDIKCRGRRISLKLYNPGNLGTSFILGSPQVEFVSSGKR